MPDVYLDPTTGDIDLTGGSMRLTAPGVEEVRQRLAARLSLSLGAWALDITAGIPWRESVFIRGVDLITVRALIAQQITSCPGVVRLESLTLALDAATRSLSLTFRALVAPAGVETVPELLDFAVGGLGTDAATLWLLLTPRGGIL